MTIFHDQEIHFEIEKTDFYDNRMQGLFEIAVATNILYRLGNPVSCEEVLIEVDGFIDLSLAKLLEDYLTKTVQSRTIIRHNCVVPKAKFRIVSGSSYKCHNSDTPKHNKKACVLLFSKGLDSLVADFLLSKEYTVSKVTFPDDYVDVKLPNRMYLDTFDNDPWNDYGLYFIFLVRLLNVAAKAGIGAIALGLNLDDLFGYDVVSNSTVYSQCSQSFEFVTLFRSICSYYNVSLILPLAMLTRTDICKIILQNSLDLQQSVSCVFYKNAECGMCFSCFDKLTGLLVAIAEMNKTNCLELQYRNNLFSLLFNHTVIMSFSNDNKEFSSLEQLPIDYIMRVQFTRIISDEPLSSIFSSKFSAINTIKTLSYYCSHDIGSKLFPKACQLYKNTITLYRAKIGKALEQYEANVKANKENFIVHS